MPLFRGRTVICAYSIEDIDQAFSTSKLKGYSSPFIGSRPGMVRKPNEFFLFFLLKPSEEKQHCESLFSIYEPLFQRWKDWGFWKAWDNKREAIFEFLCPRVFYLFKCPAWSESVSPHSVSVKTRRQEVTMTSKTLGWSDTTQKLRMWSDPSAWLRSTSPQTTKSHTLWQTSSWPSTTSTTASCTSEQVCVCLCMLKLQLSINETHFSHIEKFFTLAISLWL